mgnify:CR=1 FL=1
MNGRPAYNRGPDDLCIILCTPIMANNGIYNTRDKWQKYIRAVVQRLAREYQCGFYDMSMRHYDHSFSGSWSSFNVPPYYESHDGLHPTPYCNADFMSGIQDLLFPMGLWKY